MISESGKEWFKISLSVATGGYGTTLDGLIDLSAQYGDGARNVVVEARTYNLILKAPKGKEITFESGTVGFRDKAIFGAQVEFSNTVNFNNSIVLKNNSISGNAFMKGVATFYDDVEMYGLRNVSSGITVVKKNGGATLCTLSSSSKRYKK